MDIILDQFLNVEIMLKVWPLLLRGLGTTLWLCLIVVPLGLVGGLVAALASTSKQRCDPLASHCARRFLSRNPAACPVDPALLRFAVRWYSPRSYRSRRPRLSAQHLELLRRNLSRRHRECRPRAVGSRALHRPWLGQTLPSSSCRKPSATCCPISFQTRSK